MRLEEYTLTRAADAIRDGSLSPVEYCTALLSRMDEVEPKVQAWTTVDREAVMTEARLCETEAQRKQFRGPLHGVPIGIKDIFYTKNLKTTIGSSIFADFVPAYDAKIVKKLKQAGAIIMGKTVTTVLVFLDPGPTRNPWNTEHTPGGSSSGSAAAVAARMCPVTIGSQTVGSVGRPGAYNGVVSMMPTQARISRTGAFPLAWSLDHVGAFGRSVGDLELLLDSLIESPVPSHPALAGKPRYRIGVVRDFFWKMADEESVAQLDRLTGKLAAAGLHVEEVRLPSIFDIFPAILKTIVRAEAAAVHEKLLFEKPHAYGPKLRELVETGLLVDSSAYLRAQRVRRHYQCRMAKLFEHFDVLLTPASRTAAPHGIGATGDPILNAPWTLADFPTMTLPYALTASGMPLGVQLSAAPLREGLLLEVAKVVEGTVGFDAKPAL